MRVDPGTMRRVDAEAIGALVAVVVEQRLAVPALDQRRLALRHRDRTFVQLREPGVAADMIGVTVRVDDPGEGLVAQSARRLEECQRQRRVADVSGVDQHVAVAAAQDDVVRREPVADEDMELRRKLVSGHLKARLPSARGVDCTPARAKHEAIVTSAAIALRPQGAHVEDAPTNEAVMRAPA